MSNSNNDKFLSKKKKIFFFHPKLFVIFQFEKGLVLEKDSNRGFGRIKYKMPHTELPD